MKSPPERLDGVLLSLTSLGISLLLLQDVFLNPDAYVFLATIANDQSVSALHPLYQPVASFIVGALEVVGVRPFRGLEVVSALSIAVAVFFFHKAACLLETSRVRRNLATALCATTPSVVFFGTVIENIALLLAFASPAWWLALRCLQSPSAGRVVVVGIVTALGSFAHATGNLLPLVIIAFSATMPRAALSTGRWIGLAVLLLVSHGLALTLGKMLLGAPSGMGGSLSWFTGFLPQRGWSPAPIANKAWEEWLLPYMPLSFLALVGFARQGFRFQAFVLHAILVGYLVVAYIIIPGMWEYGSYGLPSVLFATTAVVRWAGTRVLAAAVAVSLVVALALVFQHDRPQAGNLEIADIEALAGDERPVLLVGTMPEYDTVIGRAPDRAGAIHVFQLLVVRDSEEELLLAFDTQVAALQASGMPVYLSASGRDALQNYGQVLLRHLEENYTLERRTSGDYVVFDVRRRP